jgi:hypothetical protein
MVVELPAGIAIFSLNWHESPIVWFVPLHVIADNVKVIVSIVCPCATIDKLNKKTLK